MKSIRRPVWWEAAVVLAVCVGLAVFVLWPQEKRVPRLVKAENYSGRSTACLAADSSDSSASQLAAPIWTAMQRAASAKPVNVQQLMVAAGSREQATSYLEGLVAQRCTLIVAVSPAFTDALPGVAKVSPRTRLTAVVGAGHADFKGITTVRGSADSAAAEIIRQVAALLPAG